MYFLLILLYNLWDITEQRLETIMFFFTFYLYKNLSPKLIFCRNVGVIVGGISSNYTNIIELEIFDPEGGNYTSIVYKF